MEELESEKAQLQETLDLTIMDKEMFEDKSKQLESEVVGLQTELNQVKATQERAVSEEYNQFQSQIHDLEQLLEARETQLAKFQQDWLSPEARLDLGDQISSFKHQVAFQEEEIKRLQEEIQEKDEDTGCLAKNNGFEIATHPWGLVEIWPVFFKFC